MLHHSLKITWLEQIVWQISKNLYWEIREYRERCYWRAFFKQLTMWEYSRLRQMI